MRKTKIPKNEIWSLLLFAGLYLYRNRDVIREGLESAKDYSKRFAKRAVR